MEVAAEGYVSLQQTPTWALATVCFVFIYLSIFIEHLIRHLCNWLRRHRKMALFEAVEKLKSGLMQLGFMSLILNVTQRPISRICVPTRLAYTWLPCRRNPPATKTTLLKLPSIHRVLFITASHDHPPTEIIRHLAELAYSSNNNNNGTTANSHHCKSQGKVSFISEEGVTQLSIFIFVLAVMQIVYSVLTMAFGRAKMERWKAWEQETRTVEYQAANDPNRFRFTRQTTFGRRHMTFCTSSSLLLWTKCFFRQFFHSVAKVDYLTLRYGFISAHLPNNYSFDFQKYIERSLEKDFKLVVGISPCMWIIVVFFMLLDVHGWYVYLWISFIPLTIVLVLGTKMEVVVAKMALQLKSKNYVIKGTPLVQPNDNLFWFGHPKYVLTLIHFALFMNAFELAFFIWVTLLFGIRSCYHEHVEIIVVRVVLAVTVQVMCSYITLPLYAIVTQMGSRSKSAVLEEQMAEMIKQWHADVRSRKKKERESQSGSTQTQEDHISSRGVKISQAQSQNNRSIISNTGNPANASSHGRINPIVVSEIMELPTLSGIELSATHLELDQI